MEDVKYKVLLVEDNEIERRAFERFVDSNGIPYDYVITKSVAEAQRELSCKKFDIIISDHDIGDGTAIDVLHSANNTPVIVVTGAGDEETAIKAWKAGAYDYLVKDLDQNYLKAIPITVENAIKHKEVEEKLYLLSGAIRSTEDSVFITNMCGEIIFVNKAFCKTYGYSEDEIIGKNSSILWIGKNQSESTRSVFQTRSSSGGWEVGFYHKRKDESIFPISLSRSIIKDANKKDVAIVGVARDISERLIIEDELRSTSLKFQKRNQVQNEIVIAALEVVQKLLADNQKGKAEKVIRDLLDISVLNAGTIELNRTRFNFANLIYQVEESLASYASEKNIKLTFSASDSELFVNADYERLAQALVNLLLVGIRFSSPDNDINIFMKNSGRELVVEIHNVGCDLEHNKIHQIVNNSEWIKKQFNSGGEDVALGFRIAKELIEMHGGRIWTERKQKDQGCILCFTINLISEMNHEKFEKMTAANVC
jgi:PAS domain S-box-containing protein